MNRLKERLCYVAAERSLVSSEMDLSRPPETRNYDMPDGQTIAICNERFQCPEALFQPSIIAGVIQIPFDATGVHELVNNSIMQLDADIRKRLYGNIVLSGGSTLFPGFADRLRTEISALAPPTTQVKVIDPPEREYSAWLGGSTLANSSANVYMWITKEEYDEHGPSILHRKCF